MAKITLQSLTSTFSSIAKLNANFAALVAELQDKVLYRNNPTGEPNQMEGALDMNSNNIDNAGTISTTTLVIDGVTVYPDTVLPVAGTYMVAGTEAAPGFPVFGDSNTGLFQASPDTLDVSVAGTKVFGLTSTGATIPGDLAVDDITADQITAAGMTITTGGLVISAGGLNVTGTVVLPAFTIATGSVATTQAASDNSTKVATTAYVDTAIAALPGGGTYQHARAFRSGSTHTVATATTTKIQFNAEDYDTANAFDAVTNYYFAVPTTGYYNIHARVSISNASWSNNEYVQLSVHSTNKGEFCLGRRVWMGNLSTSSEVSADVTTSVYLSAGDNVWISLYQTSGDTVNVLTGTAKTFVCFDRMA